MSTDTLRLVERWRRAKEAEVKAAAERREVEDLLCSALNVPPDLDGTSSHKISDGTTIKLVGRISYKVDSDALQDAAAAAGLSDQLPALFRWKPELNKRAWAAAHADITGPLSAAITAKPGRPSFAIVEEKD